MNGTTRPTGPRGGGDRWRVVVAGTKFGRIYLAGIARAADRYELAGVLARGGERSKAVAAHYGVPLLTGVDELPDDVDIACVVVGTAINGGPGAQLAEALLDRGVHVLQEHPVHPDELARCLRQARRSAVAYQLNTHYVHVAPVRRFLDAAARLAAAGQRPLFVDAMAGIQVTFSLLDIVGRVVGRLRPAGFADPVGLPEALRRMSELDVPYRSLDGVIGGVPVTLRVQNQLDPADPDNHAHLLHRVTVGFPGGLLTLAGTHGPVLWSPRAHLPRSTADLVDLSTAPEEYLDLPSAAPLGPAVAESYREIVGDLWPQGVARALDELVRAAVGARDGLAEGQYHLGVCKLWQEVTRRLGPPELRERPEPQPLPLAVPAGAAGSDEVSRPAADRCAPVSHDRNATPTTLAPHIERQEASS
ncbi:Gfo/Idh/MocA family oxidoreductase [Micromonospora fulviviridis]|uniref:Gfo/Idh/MocA family oxidoreductase n=1 Tax=Micromonospora fulviviridis TaxID=47860 RepID=UPI0037B4CAF8